MSHTDSPTRAAAAELGVSLLRLTRLMHAMKQHMPVSHPAVDGAAYPVLFILGERPQRISAVAELMHVDTSTVSRLVSSLDGLGLLQRVPDPEDGRAQLATLTPAGEALLTRIQTTRDAWLSGMLEDWSDPDLADFAAHLHRFTATLDAARAKAITASAPTAVGRPSTTEDPV